MGKEKGVLVKRTEREKTLGGGLSGGPVTELKPNSILPGHVKGGTICYLWERGKVKGVRKEQEGRNVRETINTSYLWAEKRVKKSPGKRKRTEGLDKKRPNRGLVVGKSIFFPENSEKGQ